MFLASLLPCKSLSLAELLEVLFDNVSLLMFGSLSNFTFDACIDASNLCVQVPTFVASTSSTATHSRKSIGGGSLEHSTSLKFFINPSLNGFFFFSYRYRKFSYVVCKTRHGNLGHISDFPSSVNKRKNIVTWFVEMR